MMHGDDLILDSEIGRKATAAAWQYYVNLLNDVGILMPLGEPGMSGLERERAAFQAVVDDLTARAKAAKLGIVLNAHRQPISCKCAAELHDE